MSCTTPNHVIEEAVRFHGHVCPGLVIGIRASEVCLEEFGHNNDEPICCVCETDMCGVDAIQFMTGCTLGKGNLMQRDYGKNAFTFYRKRDGKGIRLLLNRDALGRDHDESSDLLKKSLEGTITAQEAERMEALREQTRQQILDAPIETLFTRMEPDQFIPRPPKILETLTCEHCGEGIMESRSRRFAGQTLCIPCFAKVEQKV